LQLLSASATVCHDYDHFRLPTTHARVLHIGAPCGPTRRARRPFEGLRSSAHHVRSAYPRTFSASDGICLCWAVLRSSRHPCSAASCAPETACGTSSCVFPIPSRAPTAPCERSGEAGIPACTSRTVRSVLSVYASSACGCVKRTFFPIQALDPAPNCPPRQHPLERQAHPTIAGAPHDCKPSPGTCIAPSSARLRGTTVPAQTHPHPRRKPSCRDAQPLH
jgi:hypothetical protein